MGVCKQTWQFYTRANRVTFWETSVTCIIFFVLISHGMTLYWNARPLNTSPYSKILSYSVSSWTHRDSQGASTRTDLEMIATLYTVRSQRWLRLQYPKDKELRRPLLSQATPPEALISQRSVSDQLILWNSRVEFLITWHNIKDYVQSYVYWQVTIVLACAM